MVFLHAGIADRRSWADVMAHLSADTDVVAYDRRGFGTTTYVPEEHDQVADLGAVLDALGLERVVLVGNSRGGEIALSTALAHPGRVAALVLVAPGVAGAPAVRTEADVDPDEAALWESLEAAHAAGALDALNLGEIRFWLDGPAAPEGRVGGPRRALALDMNRIALHAESPGYEPSAARGDPATGCGGNSAVWSLAVAETGLVQTSWSWPAPRRLAPACGCSRAVWSLGRGRWIASDESGQRRGTASVVSHHLPAELLTMIGAWHRTSQGRRSSNLRPGTGHAGRPHQSAVRAFRPGAGTIDDLKS